ncbi:MAG: hypothetical protein F6K59_21730 [Moorea sp. SIO3F7]|nr:hypothetical protein [Moorena sp. SIO3E8]NEQ01440.1 hypothetical protein [Moorena sp. SIO3F7]
MKPCLDAVAHGGNPQDRAASLENILKYYANLPYRYGDVTRATDEGAQRSENSIILHRG